ncbi:NAD-dependent epimerase/dehydratase family protein [Nocardia sp. NPDC050710]|uniref:NAD-dependent epimerase/dehydratase family protein n=1 Tax=Nocardia sp. NPDC050710 TaxID=3157220 RepID=UPI0033BFB986
MKVLVTGGAGFIGSHMRRALIGAGHEVVAIDLLHPAVHGVDAQAPEGVSRIDVRDTVALQPLLRGVEVVCHLAAVTGVSAPQRAEPGSGPAARSGSRPGMGPRLEPGLSAAEFAAHNDLGTAVLLAAMGQAGIRRLVLGSSITVYGEGRYRMVHGGPFFPGLRLRADLDRGMFDHRAPRTGEVLTWEPVGEETPLRPRGFYAASKVAQENYAFAWGLATGAVVTALRYHQVYGPGAHFGLPALFRDALAAGLAPRVFEDGGQMRDFVHVDDVVAATVAAVERALPGFVPLNIASGHPVSLWQVASIMSRARGGPAPIVTGQYLLADVRHFVADPERAKRALDFTAAITPAQGLAEFAAPSTEPAAT